MNKEQALTHERLYEVLDYSPILGLFWWLKSRGTKKAESVAGTKRPDGYIQIQIDDRLYLAHRLAWLYVHGEWPPEEIDHKNNDPSDNRLANLRLATDSQNQANTPKQAHNTSGFKGVSWFRRDRKWRAEIQKDGKSRHLGYFADPVDAARAYDAKAKELHGDFARLNFPCD